ncbi:MAG: transposase [bacterium]
MSDSPLADGDVCRAPEKNMPIRKRLEIKGPALAFVTTAVNAWRPVFQIPQVALSALHELAETCSVFDVSIVAYALMPHHFHGLLGFKQIEKLSSFMQSFKSLTAREIRELLPATERMALTTDGEFHLWQPRFDDLIITSQKQFKTKLEYIHANPVRAGLVADAADWRYSSASAWLDLGEGPIAIDRHFSWTQ